MKSIPILKNMAPSRVVVRDVRFFQRNPQATAYTRSATAEERAQLDLPKGTKVVVVKLSNERHARMFSTPDEQQN